MATDNVSWFYHCHVGSRIRPNSLVRGNQPARRAYLTPSHHITCFDRSLPSYHQYSITLLYIVHSGSEFTSGASREENIH